MNRVSPRPWAVLLAMVAGSGCAVHYVSRGADLYSDGYYVEAAEVFERTEARLATSSADNRARYGLYRGVTFLALGDRHGAGRWLKYSEAQLSGEVSALSADERVMLHQALRTLAEREPSPAPPPDGTALATTRIPIEQSTDPVIPVVGP